MEITLFVDKRHVKDILRSLSHELVHHKQNCRGEFDGGINTEPGYAQNDEHMRKCEAEAYLHGSGFIFRDWEDSIKKENQVMLEENKEKLCEDCGKMHEGACGMHEEMDLEESEESLEETQGGYSGQFSDERGDPGTSQTSGQASSSEFEKHGREQQKKIAADKKKKQAAAEKRREKNLAPHLRKAIKGAVDVAKGAKKQAADNKNKKQSDKEMATADETNENWTRKNKDELLFERLVKKWTK